jgi:N utilization substance protein B
MRFRRLARERAIQFLFQHEMNPPEAIEEDLERFWKSQTSAAIAEDHKASTWGEASEPTTPTSEDDEVRKFGDPLIRGVLEKLTELDGIIEEQTRNWDIARIAKVDRNILRLAIYEMLHREDIPPVVSINEAIDIAKKFSTENSGRFVNGILDKVKGKLLRPARTPAN